MEEMSEDALRAHAGWHQIAPHVARAVPIGLILGAYGTLYATGVPVPIFATLGLLSAGVVGSIFAPFVVMRVLQGRCRGCAGELTEGEEARLVALAQPTAAVPESRPALPPGRLEELLATASDEELGRLEEGEAPAEVFASRS